jgi:hypothetical protein
MMKSSTANRLQALSFVTSFVSITALLSQSCSASIPNKVFPNATVSQTAPLKTDTVSAPQSAYIPWVSYFGAQDQAFPWGKGVRGIGRGKLLLEKDISSTVVQVENLVKQDYTVILPVSMAFRAIAPSDLIKSSSGVKPNAKATAKFKQILTEQSLRIMSIPGSADRVYWQIGNEINSRGFKRNLIAGQPPLKKGERAVKQSKLPEKLRIDDPSSVPEYVEYFLLPSLDALNAAAAKAYGGKTRPKILLGTVGSLWRPTAVSFLDVLVSYRIPENSPYPMYRGKYLTELVDIVGFDYLASLDDQGWNKTLPSLYSKWLGKNRISGVWSTEEIGIGKSRVRQAAQTAVKVASRYLSHWSDYNLSPTQAKSFFWGWGLGEPATQGKLGLNLLSQYWGTDKIKHLRPSSNYMRLNATGNLEVYLFQTQTSRNLTLIAFPRTQSDVVSLSSIRINSQATSSGANASLSLLNTSGISQPVVISSKDKSGGLFIRPASSIVLQNQDVVVLNIKAQ